jgi:hypothetical protein
VFDCLIELGLEYPFFFFSPHWMEKIAVVVAMDPIQPHELFYFAAYALQLF